MSRPSGRSLDLAGFGPGRVGIGRLHGDRHRLHRPLRQQPQRQHEFVRGCERHRSRDQLRFRRCEQQRLLARAGHTRIDLHTRRALAALPLHGGEVRLRRTGFKIGGDPFGLVTSGRSLQSDDPVAEFVHALAERGQFGFRPADARGGEPRLSPLAEAFHAVNGPTESCTTKPSRARDTLAPWPVSDPFTDLDPGSNPSGSTPCSIRSNSNVNVVGLATVNHNRSSARSSRTTAGSASGTGLPSGSAGRSRTSAAAWSTTRA